MRNFVGKTILKFAMGCHGNDVFHIAHTNSFEDSFVSHSGGRNKQFGTHEKLSWRVQSSLNRIRGYYSDSPIIFEHLVGERKIATHLTIHFNVKLGR